VSDMIGAAERYPKRTVEVHGVPMAYVEVGQGRPIVLLHGNPTSSYLWRNVLPHLEGLGRCVAPDLVGMGDSGKLPDSGPGRYSFDTHSRYLAGFLEQVGVDRDVILVVHDWGSGLGFDWARSHPGAVRGIAYMEAIVVPFRSWDDWPEAAKRVFQGMRSPAGEELVLERNVFVERILPASVLRGLTEQEMEVYRRPYAEPGESRRPTLDWPRQLPFRDEGPADVVDRVSAYADWLATSGVPKLFVDAEPGSILVGAQREFALTWPRQSVVRVAGSHFLQEDSPDEIGTAIASWVQTLD
jgi:haloalkane dehalogenase